MATPTALIPVTVETPAVPETAIALATEDLASRLGVAAEKIGVLRAEVVEWPDTSLGCPQPGKMYAQIITSGHRIILKVDGEQYEYHSDEEGKQLVLCQDDNDKEENRSPQKDGKPREGDYLGPGRPGQATGDTGRGGDGGQRSGG